MKQEKNKNPKSSKTKDAPAGIIENAGEIIEQDIVETLRENYMPYAMSVIVSRALPEIDGFKPSHRKLLYTMYKMNLLTSPRTKSANIVGQTMRLNPHGDSAIYETMVRLSRGNEALLHPYVDSKGNFSKAYSRDMAYAAARYTEAKLEPLCNELFSEIDCDSVDFIPNYDNTMKEPVLLPVRFPSILVNSSVGIAVSMASNICPFNLAEVCKATELLIRDENLSVDELMSVLLAPDFPGGGLLVYKEDDIRSIYETGRGGMKVRPRYAYNKSENCIEITEIPPTTTVEFIIDKIIDQVRLGKIKEISDARDETDLSGLRLTIDLKRGADPELLMQRLYKLTPLEDSFSCNFNVLIGGSPKVMGVREILSEWIAFRVECVKRRVFFEKEKKQKKLNLLKALSKILLDIDKAIKIIRETPEEALVVPNLMIGFGIDEAGAEYVAEIKLRNINREYITKRLEEITSLEIEIALAEEILKSNAKIKNIIIDELRNVSKKYKKERKTEILYNAKEIETSLLIQIEETPDYPVNLILTRDNYFKKITPQSYRMNSTQRLKEGDKIITHITSEKGKNRDDLLFFTNLGAVYKSSASDFLDMKSSVMGDYLPSKLGLEEGEKITALISTRDYLETIIAFFENGKGVKIPLKSFVTKNKRKKLTASLSVVSPLVALYKLENNDDGSVCDREFVLRSSANKMAIFSSVLLPIKQSRTAQGTQVMKLYASFLEVAEFYDKSFHDSIFKNINKYRVKSIPCTGITRGSQLLLELEGE